MVGVINPNKSTSLEVQKQKAGDSSFSLSPGEKFPDEAASSSVLSGAASATASSKSTAAAAGGHSSSLSGGAIAGIVIGAFAVIAIMAALFFYVGRTKSLKEKVKRQSISMSPHAAAGSPPMFQSPVGMFPQNSPYLQRSNMGGGGPPSYSPAGDEYSTGQSGGHPRSYFTEVGMYPHHNAMVSDGFVQLSSSPNAYFARLMQGRSVSRSSNTGSPPPPASSPPPPLPSPVPKKPQVHEMAG
ncbi:hypothetical protein BFW01_g4885 [Lasiodiplodia theobromae]|nr:hypothetical protein BFW01_g4885 [Lasiodiplodia theobromae]